MTKKKDNVNSNIIDSEFSDYIKDFQKNLDELLNINFSSDTQEKTTEKLSEDLNAIWKEHYKYTTEKIKNINIDTINIKCDDENVLKEATNEIERNINKLTGLNFLLEQDFDGTEITEIDKDTVLLLHRNKTIIENYIISFKKLMILIPDNQ